MKNQYSVIPAEEPESDNMFLINEMPDQVRHDKSKKSRFFNGLEISIKHRKIPRFNPAPYRQLSSSHPAMVEMRLPSPSILPEGFDPYRSVDGEIKQLVRDIFQESADDIPRSSCIIGPDEPCTSCRTCIRIGF